MTRESRGAAGEQAGRHLQSARAAGPLQPLGNFTRPRRASPRLVRVRRDKTTSSRAAMQPGTAVAPCARRKSCTYIGVAQGQPTHKAASAGRSSCTGPASYSIIIRVGFNRLGEKSLSDSFPGPTFSAHDTLPCLAPGQSPDADSHPSPRHFAGQT